MKETPRALKLREAGIKRHGSLEAWKEFQRQSGMKANRFTPRGFSVLKETDPEKLKEISRAAANKRWKVDL